MADWRQLRGKGVRVIASGVEYRGLVVELGESALVLRCATGVREIPWETVSQVQEDLPSGGASGALRG
ncbi:MAG: hypothetical protein IH608_05740 [Proteobacteria bacterium]|nr:hypothetical protein [Pseudomonadota bacterium]